MRLNDNGYGPSGGKVIAVFRAAAVLFVWLALSAGAVFASDNIVVKVIVNGETKGDYFVIIAPDREVFIKKDDLPSIGLKDGRWQVVEIGGMSYVSARSIVTVESRFDETTLSLFLTVPARGLAAHPVIDLLPQRPQRLFIPDEFSAFLNYSINYQKTEPPGLDAVTVANKVGVHAGKFLFLTDTIYTRSDEENRLVRLLSSLTYEERDLQKRYVLGDTFAFSGSLGSAINVGGLSISKAYNIDPYFIKQPMFHTGGIAPLPSEASIYVDGALVRKERIEPGEFEIRNLNYYSGSHGVDIVVRDPYGNESRMSHSAYYSDAVLGRGLHEYNYTIGAFRKDYGVRSGEYDELAFSAFHRYGVTNALTLGGWAEGSDGLIAAGPEAAYVFPRAGVVAASLGGSRDGDLTGHAESLAYYYQRSSVSFRMFSRSFSRDYLTLQTRTVPDRIRQEQGIGASYTAGYHGSVSVDLTAVNRIETGKQTIAAATYSRTIIRNLLAYLTVRTIRTASDGSLEVFIGLTYSPAKDLYLTAQHVTTSTANADTLRVEKTVPTGEGLGYHVGIDTQRTDAGTMTGVNPGALYRGRYGTYFADYRYTGTPTGHGEQYSATAAGSLVFAGGFVGFARPVNDSFGIVKVDALPGVDIKWNGEPMGKTDGDGRLVIPELRSYNVNQIMLDPGDVAMEYRLEKVGMDVSPSHWSGTCLAVTADKMQAFTGRLLMMRGQSTVPIAFGAVTLSGQGGTAELLTGQDGEFYFENTVFHDPREIGTLVRGCDDVRKAGARSLGVSAGLLTVTYKHQEKTCSAALLIPLRDDLIVELGDIISRCDK